MDHQTIVLFTGDMKIIKGINEKCLTRTFIERDVEEIKNDRYFSLIIN